MVEPPEIAVYNSEKLYRPERLKASILQAIKTG